MAPTVKSQTGIRLSKDAPTVLLLGAGYSARAMIAPLQDRGFRVIATTRTTDKAQDLEALGVETILYDGALTARLQAVLGQIDHLIISIPPSHTGSHTGDPFLNTVKNPISLMPRLRWVGYLSATSVYGDAKGGWVTEDDPPRPLTARGLRRADAELHWLETGLPVHIFRLAGIYGGVRAGISRHPFDKLETGAARAVIKAGHVVNRVHVDDIAQAVLRSIDRPNPQRLYNVADDQPAPPQDVVMFAADLLGVPRPPKVDHDSARITDMARSFYRETKRISNRRIKSELGWSPVHTHYKIGLMSTYKDRIGRPDAVIVTGYLDMPKERAKWIKLALPTHIRLTQAEPGCVRFDVFEDPDIPNRLQVVEVFDNAKAFTLHQDRHKTSEWAVVTQDIPRHYDSIGL